MEELLPKSVLIEIEKAQRQLLLGSDVKVPANAGWLKKALVWCDEYSINLGRQAGTYFYLERAGVDAIEQRLLRLGEASLKAQISGHDTDRMASASVSANEKLAKQFPTEHLVLSACTDLNCRLAHQLLFNLAEVPAQLNIELDITTLDLSLYDYLIVVENRDCFNQWHDYQVASNITRPLVIYRGHDKHHSKACYGLKSRWLKEKGVIGQIFFGDFDIAGLGIAIDSDVIYQHILVPSIVELETLLKKLHFDESHSFHLRALKERCPDKWQPLLALLLENRAGLRQQWMIGKVLALT